MSRRNNFTRLVAQMNESWLVSTAGGVAARVSVGEGNLDEVSAGCPVLPPGEAGRLSAGFEAPLVLAAPPGAPPGPRSRPACAFGLFFSASAAALAAASAAFRRYSVTGSPSRSLSRLLASTTHRESTRCRLMPRYRIVSAPNQTVSFFAVFSSSSMLITAGVTVIFTRERESVYSRRPASAKTFRVVSITSTFPSSSTSFTFR